MDRDFASPCAVLQMDEEIERLIVRMARENSSWGYDRIVGAMANLGHKVSHQTVGNILKRHDIPPAPKRKQSTSWKDFIRAHMAVMVATGFFTAEVLTFKGLKTYYVLFFIRLESRKICWAGVTCHPDQEWMEQIARNVTMEQTGILANCRYLLHDRDSKYCPSFRQLIEAEKIKALALPPQSPNLNAYTERWVRSVTPNPTVFRSLLT
jgi:putative transposase